MLDITIHNHAKEDLLSLAKTDRFSAAMLVGFFKQLEVDAHLLDRLAQHGFINETFEVQQIAVLQQKGLDFWRIKYFEGDGNYAIPYRVIYAFSPFNQWTKRPCVNVLAIMPREIDYDIKHPLIKRAINDYKELDNLAD